MKKLVYFLLFALVFPLMSVANERLLGSFPTGDQIESQYITGENLSLLVAEMKTDPTIAKYLDVLSNIDGLEVYQCGNQNEINAVTYNLAELVRNTNAKILDTLYGNATLYVINNTANKNDNALMMTIESPVAVAVMIFHGEIDQPKLDSLTK